MKKHSVLAVLLTGLALATAGKGQTSPDKVLSNRDFGDIRREVETLRGKKFLREAPVYKISRKELRAISDRELEKELPGPKLHRYEELLAWLDMVPPHTDLKSVYADFCVDQVDGFYVSEEKEICIPTYALGMTNADKKPEQKKLTRISLDTGDIVLAHEFTHALEDQYWPVDDPRDNDDKPSTDRGTAHDFVLEGSASREMIEAVPAQFGRGSAGGYFFLWNLIHSDTGEFLLNRMMNGAWKSPDVSVAGVPETLAREEAMPYSFGYTFCTGVMRRWGLDGLDYIYNHPLVSSAQVMHPKKSWEWRDFPVQIDLPEKLPGGWTQTSIDSAGEAGIAAFFGCQFENWNRGLEMARGWDGDHVALFAGTGGHRLLLWASSWDSSYAAARFVGACVQERQAVRQAVTATNGWNRIQWQSPDGRNGFIRRDGKRVIMIETDDAKTLRSAMSFAGAVTFTQPPEKAVRAAVNSPFRRFNPFWSWQKDGDYSVTRLFGGLLSRHDRNSVGASDRYLLGALAESRRTTSFHKWELGGGWIAKHEAEDRRGFAKTTVLPWGLLASHCAARLPQSPDKTITRSSVLWGLLLNRTTEPGESSIHVLGTGVSRKESINHAGSRSRFRLFGILLWTTHTPPPKNG